MSLRETKGFTLKRYRPQRVTTENTKVFTKVTKNKISFTTKGTNDSL